MKETYKYIALGILIGYLSPYVLALVKGYQAEQNSTEEKETSHEY